jgi:F-type H+-transporting ATPase subunit a
MSQINNNIENNPESNIVSAEAENGLANHQGLEQNNEAQAEHEHTLFAEPLFNIYNFPVTNSLISSWLAVILIVILSLVIRAKNSKIPGKFQSFMEVVIEGAFGMIDMVTNDRAKSKKVFPVAFSIFVFVLVNNWLGMFPGVGSITFNHLPLLRGGTADLNTTLALGLFAVVAANIFGIMTVGGWNYFNKFINIKALLEIPKKIKHEPTIVLVNPINFFVGLIEIISEVAKVASLSFRLFGNVFAGEVLLASITAMVAWGVPLPFMFLEILVGVIQALIFSVLTVVYFTIASADHSAEH